jgi:hypothetical protein
MYVLVQDDEFLNVFKGQVASFARLELGMVARKRSLTIGRDNWYGLSTGVIPEPAGLVCIHMGAVITDDGIWRLLEMCTNGQLVGHCTRRDKQGGFLPEQSCHVGFEGGTGSIRHMIDVVSERGLNGVLVHLPGGN